MSVFFEFSFLGAQRMALGESHTSCCDVAQIGVQANCSEAPSSGRRKRATDTQINGENRPLDGQSDYTYYVMSATPTSDGPVFAASSRSQPFSSMLPCKHNFKLRFNYKKFFNNCSRCSFISWPKKIVKF